MSKSKSIKERYVQIVASVFDSPAFRTLPPSALKLWVDLRTKYNGRNNGNISAALSVLRGRGWCSSGTLDSAIWELLARGLLRRTREGKPGPFRLCALYAFTDLPAACDERLGVKGAQATREFATWTPGKSFAPEKRARKLPANANRKKQLLQEPTCYRSDDRSVTAPTIEEWIAPTAPKIEAVNPRETV